MDTAPAPPDAVPLVVDLDGTLLKTDLLHESLLALAAEQPAALPGAVAALRRGKLALKAYLADRVAPDVEHLPYDEAVLTRIRAAQAEGREVHLVSASDARLVRAVADHLGLFTDAVGSETVNLSGAAKAAHLTARFGAGGFDYMADARADLPVWAAARKAITVGAAPALRAEVARRTEAEHIDRPHRRRDYLRALRPHQWLKNLLVFVPLIAAHNFGPFWAAFGAAVAFSLTASAVYVLNDLLDLTADRQHARKRTRPFASGAVPISHGLVLAGGLLLSALAAALLAAPPIFLAVLAFYFAITSAYSLFLKRRPVIDICTLAGLYTLRVIAGAAASGIPLSPWLLAFSVFLFLALAAIKRQAELVEGQAAGQTEVSGRGYRTGDLPVVEMMALAGGYNAVLVLALYINSAGSTGLYTRPELLWGACPVLLYWISRLVMIGHRGDMHDDPVVFAITDRTSQMCGAFIAAFGIAASIA